MTDAPVPTLAEILTLEPSPGEDGATGDDTFLGHSPLERRARVFGGQVVAQALVAASQTTPAAHRVLSASFHAGGPSGDYEPPAPLGIPGPEHLPSTRFAKPGVLETRDASYDQPRTPQRRLWFRAGCELAPELHAAGIAYATDHGPFGAARRIVDTAGRRIATVAQEILARAPQPG